jgi:hypothetical protein
MRAMSFDDTILYEQFVDARLKAVELTDAFRETPTNDSRRAVMWDEAMRQTELARGLLESYLAASQVPILKATTANTLHGVR